MELASPQLDGGSVVALGNCNYVSVVIVRAQVNVCGGVFIGQSALWALVHLSEPCSSK